MKFTVYKITNKINGKIYVGCHKTNDLDDGYMGSGLLIKRAIEKHGLDNFEKEYLHIFDNSEDMFEAEAKEVELGEHSYNLKEGGHGGWDFVNSIIDRQSPKQKKANRLGGQNSVLSQKEKHGEEWNKRMIEGCKKYLAEQAISNPSKFATFKGKTHTEDTKRKIGAKNSKNQMGKNNSQYGMMWITNGEDNKKILKTDSIPNEYKKGRKIIKS